MTIKTNSVDFNYQIVRLFTIASSIWGIIGFLAGVFIALQLAYPALNFNSEWTTFGRLRPIHTTSVIFAFGGNALFATSFFVVQRTSHARLWGSPKTSKFHFLGLSSIFDISSFWLY